MEFALRHPYVRSDGSPCTLGQAGTDFIDGELLPSFAVNRFDKGAMPDDRMVDAIIECRERLFNDPSIPEKRRARFAARERAFSGTTQDRVRDEISRGNIVYIALTTGKKVAGALHAPLYRQHPIEPFDGGEPVATDGVRALAELYVMPQFRNRGVRDALMKRCDDDSRDLIVRHGLTSLAHVTNVDPLLTKYGAQMEAYLRKNGYFRIQPYGGTADRAADPDRAYYNSLTHMAKVIER